MNKGVILAETDQYPLVSELNVGDLVYTDYEYFDIIKIDPKFNRNEFQPDNPFKYFVESIRGEEMNFAREELIKCKLVIYDYTMYYDYNQKIFLGNIDYDDINELKYKFIYENDLDISTFKDVRLSDLLNMTYIGKTIYKNNKRFNSLNTNINDQTKIFKLSKSL